MEESIVVYDSEVVRCIEIYGGSFIKALSALFRCADAENTKRLKSAFPDYWEKYKAMALADKRKNQ